MIIWTQKIFPAEKNLIPMPLGCWVLTQKYHDSVLTLDKTCDVSLPKSFGMIIIFRANIFRKENHSLSM